MLKDEQFRKLGVNLLLFRAPDDDKGWKLSV